MPQIFKSGTQAIRVVSNWWGMEHVAVQGMPDGCQVLLSPRTTDAGGGPDGAGPFFCAFCRQQRNGFLIYVHDIANNPHTATVQVDWAVVAP